MLALAVLGLCNFGHFPEAHDRPSGPIQKTRSTVVAPNGMVCTSEPLATAAGLRVLQNGARPWTPPSPPTR